MPATSQTEIELKFLVPQASRAALAIEMARKSATLERRTLAAMYLDTGDRRLARAGIAWRLRREGRRWIQTLKADGASAIERFEHEVIRPGPVHDATVHAGTRAGDKLLGILRDARDEGLEVGVRFQTDVRRISRRIRTRGAVVEVAFDEGRLLANGARARIREVEFELVSGSASAMLALAERWRKRFSLLYDPRSKAERGDRLAGGSAFPPIRKARSPKYSDEANAIEAFAAVLDECLAHISRNAVGLFDGDPAQRVEHVHQLRVGIRRLRSALRSFEQWVPPAPKSLVDDLKSLFADMGRARDSDVLDSGVAAELDKVGAPPLAMPAGEAGPDPAELIRASAAQQTLLAWIAWRVGLADGPEDAVTPVAAPLPAGSGASEDEEAKTVEGESSGGADSAEGEAIFGEDVRAATETSLDDARTFQREAARRLRRWHRKIAADWKNFDQLEEEGLHSLRKRIKRQRYAVEFFAPALRRRQTERYLEPLTAIQDRMGELNDLFVARGRYEALVASDPAAWFALGWLAARVAEVRLRARPELKQLAKADPPGR